MKWLICTALAASLVVFSSCSQKKDELPPINIEQAPAPSFEFNDITGTPINSNSLKGKWVVINIFATWSPASIKEIPGFTELQTKMKEKNVQFIGISIDERGIDDVRPYAQRIGINYPIACVGLDSVKAVFGGLDTIPTTFLISPDWHYMNKHNGLVGADTMEVEINAFIKAFQAEQKQAAQGTNKPKL